MPVRFIHSSDWQLGMRRRFLGPEAQARFSEARFAAVRSIGRLAAEQEAQFVLVAGDVFESNQVDRQTVGRALEALRTVPVPVYLLPGNHDPLEPSSIYHSTTFTARRPPNVTVLSDSEPVEAPGGVELIAAPWCSKRPLFDLVDAACAGLERSDKLRICVGHGPVDVLCPDRDNPAAISLQRVEDALSRRCIDYLALGDRHSAAPVGGTGRAWYAGAPEPTDYDETDSGRVLVVDLSRERCTATPHPVGRWRFLRNTFELAGTPDIGSVERWLDGITDKSTAVVKLAFIGQLTLRCKADLDDVLDRARDLFASIEDWDQRSNIVVLPDDIDLVDLELSGFARHAFDDLVERARAGSQTSAQALGLLYRLVRSAA